MSFSQFQQEQIQSSDIHEIHTRLPHHKQITWKWDRRSTQKPFLSIIFLLDSKFEYIAQAYSTIYTPQKIAQIYSNFKDIGYARYNLQFFLACV